jgi:hypothetical protein
LNTYLLDGILTSALYTLLTAVIAEIHDIGLILSNNIKASVLYTSSPSRKPPPIYWVPA